MDKLFQVPATISKVTSMANRSVRIQADTQENLTDDQMGTLMSQVEKYGHWCFLPDDREIDTLDVIDLPPLKAREEDERSPSTRQRAVLFILWKQNGEKGDFDTFYRAKIEQYINAVKEKLT